MVKFVERTLQGINGFYSMMIDLNLNQVFDYKTFNVSHYIFLVHKLDG